MISTSQPNPLGPDPQALLAESGFVHDDLPAGGWRCVVDGPGGVLAAARSVALVLGVAFGARDDDRCDLEHWHDAGSRSD